MAFTVNNKAFRILEFAKTESIVTVQRRFRIMYHTEPPTEKILREWYMNSSRVAACALRNEQAVRSYGPPATCATCTSSGRRLKILSIQDFSSHSDALSICTYQDAGWKAAAALHFKSDEMIPVPLPQSVCLHLYLIMCV